MSCVLCFIRFAKKAQDKNSLHPDIHEFLGGFLGSPRALCLMSCEIRSQQYLHLRVRIFIIVGTQQYLLSPAEAS